jgi:choline-glycine betaine transporter
LERLFGTTLWNDSLERLFGTFGFSGFSGFNLVSACIFAVFTYKYKKIGYLVSGFSVLFDAHAQTRLPCLKRSVKR